MFVQWQGERLDVVNIHLKGKIGHSDSFCAQLGDVTSLSISNGRNIRSVDLSVINLGWGHVQTYTTYIALKPRNVTARRKVLDVIQYIRKMWTTARLFAFLATAIHLLGADIVVATSQDDSHQVDQAELAEAGLSASSESNSSLSSFSSLINPLPMIKGEIP